MNLKRRCLSLALGLLLAMSLCVPSLAADATMDQELTEVTLAVKKAVDVSGSYTEFNGTVQDMGVLRYWSLSWSDDEGGYLNILASATGKIMQYSVNQGGVMPLTSGGYAPALAKVTAAQAAKTAGAFLDRVLSSDETAALTADSNTSPLRYSGGDYSFSAQLKLNSVASPTHVQIQVDATDGAVTYFSRDDVYEALVGTVPSASPKVTAAAAASSLSATVKLELQYVDADEGTAAVLRYVPLYGGDLYVDAQTGTVVDLTSVWDGLNTAAGGSGDGILNTTAAREDSDSDGGLSDAEQAAIQKLQGVLSKDALDAAVRKVTALGLSPYTLSSASYNQDPDTDDVVCTLWYKRTPAFSELKGVSEADYRKGGYVQFKSLMVDAKTGALLSGWGYRPSYMKDAQAGRAQLQNTADAFLKLYCPDHVSHVALYGGEGGEFRYDRQENGYFYHNNGVDITVDPGDGSVMCFSCNWDDDLKFQSADGAVAEKAALAAYCGAYAARLQYIAYPVSVDTSIPVWKIYADACGTVGYRYVLGYTYEADGKAILGVDAKTGKLVRAEPEDVSAAYSDIAFSYAKTQIQALADAGIRFSGSGKFQPAAKLTQQDLLVLLLNSCGYSFDTEDLDDGALDQLYEAAWNEGFLARGTRSPEQAVTRLELVKALVSASPYSQAAQLKGIFVTSFRDASQVPFSDLGYLAIAQGLGIVSGKNGKFYPARTATRQEAAMILYNYMSR
ncbi:putative surface layer protein [Oscillibacter valericigenes Sjm18-20]|nr:putative surface layer protein [Oscillibacter valericigenes Sjm18-20]